MQLHDIKTCTSSGRVRIQYSQQCDQSPKPEGREIPWAFLRTAPGGLRGYNVDTGERSGRSRRQRVGSGVTSGRLGDELRAGVVVVVVVEGGVYTPLQNFLGS